MKECPLPTFGLFSCIGSKFTWMSPHPRMSFVWSLRSTATSAMHISGKKLWVILHWRHLCIEGHSYRELQWCGAVLCAVRAQLWSRWWSYCMLLFVQLLASRAFICYKHDMGTLSWLNVELLKTFWQTCRWHSFAVNITWALFHGFRLVRCSVHGRSFGRLGYIWKHCSLNEKVYWSLLA